MYPASELHPAPWPVCAGHPLDDLCHSGCVSRLPIRANRGTNLRPYPTPQPLSPGRQAGPR